MAKILLAEDDVELSLVIRSHLLFEHHQVESAADGQMASTKAKISEFDLLILDWDLPGKSGLEIIAEMRRDGKDTPILIITGKTAQSDKVLGLDCGSDDYMTKRHKNRIFSAEALIAKVWPSDSESTAEAVRTTITRLRKKIDPEQKLLRNVHGVGYVLEESDNR